MFYAVMSNSLNSIMLKLRNSMDSTQNVTDLNAVCDVIGHLENFPMTMIQLQDTRIGQLLQTIRHKVDPPLQKRIRLIIKAWQKLLSSEYSHQYVIPLKTSDKNIPTSPRSNGTPIKISARERSRQPADAVNAIYPPQMKSSVHLTKRNFPDSPSEKLNKDDSQKSAVHLTHQNDNYVSNISKRLKCVDTTSTVVQVQSPSNLVNGSKCMESQPQNTGFRENLDTSVPQTIISTASRSPSSKLRVANSMRLTKVKSTAELVQAAGDCIDSVTADRILTNRISKEVDPPRVCSIMQPTKTRLARANSGSQSSSRCVSANNNETSHSPKCNTILDLKSEIPLECRESPAVYEKDHNLTSDSVKSVIPFVNVSSINNQSPISYNSENISNRLLFKDVENNTASIAQKVKKKKKHKHHKDEAEILGPSRLHSNQLKSHRKNKTVFPPVTNFMNDWPDLPCLPENIDWHSLDRSYVTVCDNSSMGISEYNSPKKCTVGTETEYACISPTNLHSIILDDQYLHILPWVDMIGYKRHFFPSCSDQELSELTTMPEPW
ncbi:unnamed protein product [Schistosoma mattheei]|uniref:TFIIS N-terminal domain-containing protein n=2 Tax=Schistosoma mattheei TaxID=31246 RepID=A0AA85AWM2_9TREM|nr:unnamed protein product [Schistosoma mattheei]